jgi:hypothetical protein
MSMLTFYVTRWARACRPKTLEGVKDELRRLFDKQKGLRPGTCQIDD